MSVSINEAMTADAPKEIKERHFVSMNQPITLYRLRVLAGTHTQDELFLLKDEELEGYIADLFLEIPRKCRTRRQVEKYLNAMGHGIERTYLRNEEFTFYEDLSRKCPGKIARIGTGNNTPPELQMQPGETLQEFAIRIQQLAQREDIRAQQMAMAKQGVNGNLPDSQGNDPVINAINGNRNLFPKSQAEPEPYVPVAFETFTLEQLKEYAAEREINMEGCKTKNQYIQRLRGIDASITLNDL